MASVNLARFNVSKELIGECLALPDGMEVVSVHPHPTMYGVLIVVVESNELGPVAIGEPITEYHPKLTIDGEKKPSTWITFDLGEKI